jgi:hypothetical protein|mmetsp:Transcript_28190/g.69540  ORF Transcript_28190/g.69540 Transcript_28190/m.69540 type:complete len:87 (+) Transcript_28190:39-299(+)
MAFQAMTPVTKTQSNVMLRERLVSSEARLREMITKASPGYTKMQERCRKKVFVDHLDPFDDAENDVDVENELGAPWTISGYRTLRS